MEIPDAQSIQIPTEVLSVLDKERLVSTLETFRPAFRSGLCLLFLQTKSYRETPKYSQTPRLLFIQTPSSKRRQIG